MPFTHLHVHTAFSMLDGAATAEALCKRAAEHGMSALAVTDHDGLYGAVRFNHAAKLYGIRPIFGTEITLEDRSHLTLLARDQEGWRNLCRILTRAHLGSPLHEPRANLETIARHQEGLFILTGCRKGQVSRALLEEGFLAALRLLERYAATFGRERVFVELQRCEADFPEQQVLRKLTALAELVGLRTVATNNVHLADADDQPVQDALTCIRLIQPTTCPHPDRHRNAERRLKSEQEMRALFAEFPEAIENTEFLARGCKVSIDIEGWRLPAIEAPPGETPMRLLRRTAEEGLERRLRSHVGEEYRARLEEELALIEEMGFVDYFLICHDIVRHARSKGIRTTGRGSAGNSLVAFALDITAPDPVEHGLIFQRFMNRERTELPDVDIDFCSRRRDEVLEYIYARYGEDRVAAVATVNTFRARSSVRDVAKALGYSPEEIDDIARVFPFLKTSDLRGSLEKSPEVKECRVDLDAVREAVGISERITGFPRHLGIHVGGIIIADRPLTDYVPLQKSTKGIVICQFDKDDVEALGLVKLDILGLRIHSAIERCLDLVERQTAVRPDIDAVPLDDAETYRLMQEARTVGCFQLESPGERSLQVRLLPGRFRDVIANISLFRPGPVQADMVTPFVERRHGREPVRYVHPCLEEILGETYGVITYQEEVLMVAHAIAGFSLAEADSLRRAMTKDISPEDLEAVKRRFIEGAMRKGVSRPDAEEVFRQIAGFAAYGFCKGHAACFGLIAYQTAYLKTHHPAEFLAGVLSNEPMGFYSARTILEEAKRCGVRVLPVDVNRSEEQFSVENGALRIGLMQVAGLSEKDQHAIVRGRASTERGGVVASSSIGVSVPNSREGRIALDISQRLSIGGVGFAPPIDNRLGCPEGGPSGGVRGGAPTENRYTSLLDFCRRVRVDRDSLEKLILVGAFDALPAEGPEPEPEMVEFPSGTTADHVPFLVRADALEHRRRLLWRLPFLIQAGVGDGQGSLAMPPSRPVEPPPLDPPASGGRKCASPSSLAGRAGEGARFSLPACGEGRGGGSSSHASLEKELILLDYDLLHLSALRHPMAFVRERLQCEGCLSSADLYHTKAGTRVRTGGVIVSRNRPPTKSGRIVVFVTLEDELGLFDAVVFESAYMKWRGVLFAHDTILIEGRLERPGDTGVSVIVDRVEPLRPLADTTLSLVPGPGDHSAVVIRRA